MTTFLQLCIDASRESGAVGRAPTAVTGQTGRQEKVVSWVREAWRQLQLSQPNWAWMRTQFTSTLNIGQSSYNALGFGLAADRFSSWVGDQPDYRPMTLYDPTIGIKDETNITEISFEQWRRSYDIGEQILQKSTRYCIAPDRTLRFGAIPDKAYTVRGEYRKAPQVLTANSDVPELPEEFHSIIVWAAIILMAKHDESPTGLQAAVDTYRPMLYQLQASQLPEITTAAEPPMDYLQ